MTLEAHGLRTSYGAVVAPEELSFTAGPGEVIGLMGPNGAGKTTAIRPLTTMLPATGGAFAVAGIPHTRPTGIRQRVGVLPESAGYPRHQTRREYLRYHARLFGHSKASAEDKADALPSEVGLDERRSSPIAVYSRGPVTRGRTGDTRLAPGRLTPSANRGVRPRNGQHGSDQLVGRLRGAHLPQRYLYGMAPPPAYDRAVERRRGRSSAPFPRG